MLELNRVMVQPKNEFGDPTNSLFGIEIEAEKVGSPDVVPESWHIVGDSSLKDHGAEFVSKPLLMEAVEPAIVSLYNAVPAFAKQKASFGPRTSIHIHSNIRWMENQAQLMPLIFAYLLQEDLMYSFVAPSRRSNIFCVRAKEGDWLAKLLSYGCIEENNTFKYSGFNLQSVLKHGTVEFRHLEGTYDIKKILNWVKLIDNIQTYAKQSVLGLAFMHEIRKPVGITQNITEAYKPYFDQSTIDASISDGLEYFRYVVADGMTSFVRNALKPENFNKFYNRNYLRVSK